MANPLSAWTRFWHQPVRAERLAVTRIFLALALLTDQLFQFLPRFAEFFGPEGVAPRGTHEEWSLRTWRWTVFFFHTDNLPVLYGFFSLWVGCTLALLVGWKTRFMKIAVWFLALCFLDRNPSLLNFGDEFLKVGLFLLMISPCGAAFSVDNLRRKAQDPPAQPATPQPATTPAWPVRLFQIQLTMIYFSTGLSKLLGEENFFEGTWWDGTSLHYTLNYITRTRWSYAQLPLPLWLTAAMTYFCVWWEVLFPLLVLCRWTRKWTLCFGILFHLGILVVLEIGWFCFYALSFYGVWIPGEFWDRLRHRWRGGPVHGATRI